MSAYHASILNVCQMLLSVSIQFYFQNYALAVGRLSLDQIAVTIPDNA